MDAFAEVEVVDASLRNRGLIQDGGGHRCALQLT